MQMYSISNPLSLGNEARERERDDNTLRVPLREPPCMTCKKEQAGIRLQEYLGKAPRSKETNSFILFFHVIHRLKVNMAATVPI